MSRNLVKNCMSATGNSPVAALLLMRIAFWDRHTTVERDGRKWIVRNQKEWSEETGLTHQQVKDAFVALRKHMLIETRKGLWANKLSGFVRLTSRGQTLVQGDQETPNVECPQTPNYIQGEYNKGSSCPSDIQNLKPPYPPDVDLLSGETQAIPTSPSKEAQVVTVKELLATGIKKSKPTPKSQSVQSLIYFWKVTVNEVYDCFVQSFTMKQTGQMKHFLNACSPGTAEQVLDAVIRDWSGFTADAKSHAGVSTAPSTPQIDFLLKHTGIAVNFWKNVPAQTVSPSVGGQPIPEVQLTAHADAVEPEAASAEDVEEILGVKLKKKGAGHADH